MEYEVRLSRRIGDFDWHLSRGRWSSIPPTANLTPLRKTSRHAYARGEKR